MDDFISREYLLAEYDRQHQGPPGGARKIIAEAPAADVVEVVRCGYCKYWKQRDNREYGLCVKHRGIWLNSDFCSKGEHKDGGQDE